MQFLFVLCTYAMLGARIKCDIKCGLVAEQFGTYRCPDNGPRYCECKHAETRKCKCNDPDEIKKYNVNNAMMTDPPPNPQNSMQCLNPHSLKMPNEPSSSALGSALQIL